MIGQKVLKSNDSSDVCHITTKLDTVRSVLSFFPLNQTALRATIYVFNIGSLMFPVILLS